MIEAANYVAQHSMMHYGGRYETVDLVLTNEQAETRLENSIQTIEDVKEALEDQIHEIKATTMETGSSPNYVEKAYEEAENTLEDLEDEIELIKNARERPPEEETDQEYVTDKDTEAETLADRLDFTPTRYRET